MNSIIKSWHSKGLHTTQEILAGDGAGRGREVNEKGPAPAGADESEMQQMREYLKSLREKS